MKKYAIIGFLALFSVSAHAEVADSVGTKVKNGKVYILHKVEQGQGLFGISKRYGVKLTDLIAENPGSESVIKVDQVIWVPTNRPVKLEEPVVEDFFERTEVNRVKKPQESPVQGSETFAVYHTVSSGETLFRIAARYGTTVAVIKDLNNLESDLLSIGQRLLVPGEDVDSEATELTQPAENQREKPKESPLDTPYTMDLETETGGIAIDPEPQPKSTDPIIVVEGYTIKVTRLEEYDLEQVEETGSYAMAGASIPESRYWAAHFSAPLGTVILVTNPANGKNVFVKVVENFERATESAVILKLSKITVDSIGLDKGATIQLSYAR